MNLYRVTKFSIYLSFTVHYNYTKIGRFTPILSIRIVLRCFYLLISHFENFSTWISRLPFALNATLDLSTTKILLTPALILEAEINSIFFFVVVNLIPVPSFKMKGMDLVLTLKRTCRRTLDLMKASSAKIYLDTLRILKVIRSTTPQILLGLK